MNNAQFRQIMGCDMIRESQQYDATHPPKMVPVEPEPEKEETVTILDNGLLDGIVCCMPSGPCEDGQ